jgi:sugar lactone lactonase YvrE
MCLAFALLASAASAQWTTGQNAAFVIGQPNFTTTGAAVDSTNVNDCRGIAVDVQNGKLYVSDWLNNRVLRFAYPITANEPVAEIVFGQPNFTSNAANSGGLSAASLRFPFGIAVDSTGRLWVSDAQNHRVVAYDAAHAIAANMPMADLVLGQANFTSGAGATGANRMNFPNGVAVDSLGNVYVADVSNNRVLRFDAAGGIASGDSADAVYGQANFTNSGTGAGAAGMNNPRDMGFDSTGSLFVADQGNNRVLRFDDPLSDVMGATADGVLGQLSFATVGAATTATGFNSPHGVECDIGDNLYVTDANNNRTLVFLDVPSKADGAAADFALGQSDLMSGMAATTQNRGNFTVGVCVDSVNGFVITTEAVSQRALVWQASAPLPVEASAFSLE